MLWVLFKATRAALHVWPAHGGRTCPYRKQVHGWFRHDDEEDVEEVPLCRDVAASACSFGLVLTQIKELVSRSQGLFDQMVDVPVPKVTGEIPVFVGVWEETTEAIQLVLEEQVFQSIREQVVDGTERVVEQVVIPRLQMSGRVVEQIVIPHAQESERVVEQIVPVLSFQQFEEDGVDVAQFIPQERMQCTVEQIVGVTVLQIM